tara:strand:- start:403 stop:1893 length:1491 start_codon:yes stop_codon:yes gene_type:complete
MRKDNLLAKKIKRKFLSINDFLENNFNNLTFFFKDLKRKKLGTNGKVILGLGVSLIAILSYFLLPTFNSKDQIQAEIENHILKKYSIDLIFNEELNYSLLPSPHYSSKNVSILKDEKKIAKVKNIKILISSKNFFAFNNVSIKDIIFNNADFNIQLSDLSFFQKLLKTEPNENKIIIKNSNIFYENKNEEILFINKIRNSKFFYDSKNLQNALFSENKIFNLPFKLLIKNDKFNKKINTNFNSKKIRLNIDNEIDYNDKIKKGNTSIRFINKSTLFDFKIDKNSLKFLSTKDNNVYKGQIDFKPFYFTADFNYAGISSKNLFNENSLFLEIIRSEIFNNRNLNAKININLQDITDINELNSLFLKIDIEEGEINFSESNLMWKKDLKIKFNESFLIYSDNEIKFIGNILLEFEDLDNFYRSFQIKKDNRNRLKKIELDFIYSVDKRIFNFNNVRVDNVGDKNLEKYLDNFNSSQNKIFNKITFKNFVSDFFSAYAG